jgi:hypothetical protein
MRSGKRPLHLPFAKAVEDHSTEQQDKHRDGKHNRTKVKAHEGRDPSQRQPPAVSHRLLVNGILWQTMVTHRRTSLAPGTAGDPENVTLGVAPAASLQLPARVLVFDSLHQSTRAVGSLLAAAGRGFLDGLFDRFPSFAGALLNAAHQFIVLALGASEIVIRELGPLLFQLALGNVPVALEF